MSVARIVTPSVNQDSQALKKLTERLQAAGYEVDIVLPNVPVPQADLVVEIGELPTQEALETAFELARGDDADLFLAPGLFDSEAITSAASKKRVAPEREEDDVVASVAELCEGESRPVEDERELADTSALAGSDELKPPVAAVSGDENEGAGLRATMGNTVQHLGATIQPGSVGMRQALAGVYGRVAGALSGLQQRRTEAMQAMREERERREVEHEQQRREREAELQRQAEEKLRLMAERERQAAERARELREQQAREAALRAEIERAEREALAREAARRAQEAQAAEQERRRHAALEAERVRIAREQEARRAAAMAAERTHQDQEQQRGAAAAVERTKTSAASRPASQSALRKSPAPVMPQREPPPKPRIVPRPHRRPTTRERQWQRAAFVASVTTLAAMVGFAIAANRHPLSPIPQALKLNEAQQQVPFGPARIDVTSAKMSHVPAPALSLPSRNGELGGTPVGTLSRPSASPSQKPSAARGLSKRPTRRTRVDDDEDEVMVRHLRPRSTQKQNTASGVRHYSDQD